jgi:hypothetical protein
VFKLVREHGTDNFAGYAGGAADVDQDGDADIFVQDYRIRLLVNLGGLQGGLPGEFVSSGGINLPAAYDLGYRDMGGTITLGDLNADGLPDAFVVGCCYGVNADQPDVKIFHGPSMSWVWINDGRMNNLQTGHIIQMESLDGLPVREAALGDLDGDGHVDIYVAVDQATLGRVESLADRILLNDDGERFATYELPSGMGASTSVALGDVNSDGRLDALVGTDGGARLMLNQGVANGEQVPDFIPSDESFETLRSLSERLGALVSSAAEGLFGLYLPYGSIRTKAVFLADLDGDGDQDALLARLRWAEIWWNDGNGEFQRSERRYNYREDTGVAVADFDGDGDIDIFEGRNEPQYRLWRNDGQGAFTALGR